MDASVAVQLITTCAAGEPHEVAGDIKAQEIGVLARCQRGRAVRVQAAISVEDESRLRRRDAGARRGEMANPGRGPAEVRRVRDGGTVGVCVDPPVAIDGVDLTGISAARRTARSCEVEAADAGCL